MKLKEHCASLLVFLDIVELHFYTGTVSSESSKIYILICVFKNINKLEEEVFLLKEGVVGCHIILKEVFHSLLEIALDISNI